MHERLRPRVVARRTALDQVAREGERRAGEPDQRHVQLLPQQTDRLEQVRLVDLRFERAEPIEVARGADGLVDDGPRPGLDANADPDRRERDHDVAEHDRGVERHPAERLERDLDGQLRVATGLEDVSLATELAVFGQVAPGLAHEPHGREVHGLAAQRAQEAIVHGAQHTDDDATLPPSGTVGRLVVGLSGSSARAAPSRFAGPMESDIVSRR